LREAGLKVTPQRVVVITELVNDKSHPSAIDIYRRAREKMPPLTLSTVYNILGLLKKHKFARELELEDMDNRDEAGTRNYHNLVCSACGKIEDFAFHLPVPVEVVHKETGFRAIETRIEYYGLCRECNAKS
jgi:Fur family peroxide stress response transcriptional regulator